MDLLSAEAQVQAEASFLWRHGEKPLNGRMMAAFFLFKSLKKIKSLKLHVECSFAHAYIYILNLGRLADAFVQSDSIYTFTHNLSVRVRRLAQGPLDTQLCQI